MTEEEIDIFMRKILLDSLKLEWSDYLESAPPVETSKQYLRQMKKMLKDPLTWVRDKTRPVWRKVLHRAASILIVCTITFGTVMATSPTVRAAVLQWIIEWYETNVIYAYLEKDMQPEVPPYEITALPGDYIEKERIIFFGYESVTYENEDGKLIYLDYSFIQDGTSTNLLISNVTVSDITVNGYSGQLFMSQTLDQTNAITWIDKNENLQFVVDGYIDEVELMRFAESVALIGVEK